ncbi:puromycin-sensitive aminopeptidase-like [Planococcus citri]|uniref:puromycin-sensitive aminopeptidase-like n=1 Tax=Planococcus citri TaxID=170843 RepID=UPI0031F91AD3
MFSRTSLYFQGFIFLQLWCFSVAVQNSTMSEKKKFERLPTTVKPTVYDLFLKPDLKTFRFEGKETVFVQIVQPTDKIILNCVDLNISQAQLKLTPSGEILPAECSICAEEETLKLTFPKDLPVGDAELSIAFVGELNTLMKGFYRSKYTAVAGKEDKYCAVTQFEATDARRCFPCWDEPAIKARFDITLAVDADKLALSNMPVESEKVNDGVKVVKFQRTPIMSTYLVAMVVGDFDYVEDKTSDGILVRVYTPPGKKEQGRFALHCATKVLPYYKEYFNIAYPLPKMDLIAIAEFSAGAMENWGLVTYRETYLLVDESNTSAATKQHVAIVVGHELAHQWFGNLVTMEWWTDLWLNEGYASFVEYLCVAYLFPEYDIWTQFVTDMHCRALELDALKNSHPIEIPVGHPSEVDEIFDEISYDKGGSVIRMLHRYIGDNDFRKGMNLYLTRHQYGNTHTLDLWTALEEASSKPIKKVMPTWTQQKGYPVITIESSVQEANNVRTLIVRQSKFSIDLDSKDDQTSWLVPITFSKQSNPKEDCFSTVLEGRQCKISIPNVSPNEWIKVNPGTVGFYRTNYTADMLKVLIPSIADKTLPPLDRLGILDDLFALVIAGQSDAVQVLELMLAMIEEENYTVWTNMATCLERFYSLLSNTDFNRLYDLYGLKLVKPISKKLGVDAKPGESHLVTLLRSLILNRLVKFGDEEFLHLAKERFAEHYSSRKTIPADLRTVIYKGVIAAEGKPAFDSLIDMYKKTDLQEEKERILRSFSSITDPSVVDEALKFAQSDDVTSASTVTALTSISASKVGRDKSWQFVKENWPSLSSKYAGGFLITRIVKHTTENFASEERAKEVEEFFADKDRSGIERTISQCLETIRNSARWLKKDGDSIKAYLEKIQS